MARGARTPPPFNHLSHPFFKLPPRKLLLNVRMGGAGRGVAVEGEAGRVESSFSIVTEFAIGFSHSITMRHRMRHDPYYQKRDEKNRTRHRPMGLTPPRAASPVSASARRR